MNIRRFFFGKDNKKKVIFQPKSSVLSKYGDAFRSHKKKRTVVFIESIMVKMEFGVTMGLYRKGVCLIK